jgi:hypothetical protein
MVLPTEIMFGFGLWFSPGWAKGWPGGLPIQLVYSTGLSLLLFIVFMTVASGTGAIVLAISRLQRLKEEAKLQVFVTWLLLAGLAVSPIIIAGFFALHSAAMEMWPDGYNR